MAIALLPIACGQGSPASDGAGRAASAPPASAPVTEARAVARRPADTRPLPALAADPGGATGKPLRGLGFGGLGIDAARAVAVTPAGEAYLAGYFDGEGSFGPAGKIAAAAPADDRPAAGSGRGAARSAPTDAFLVKVGAEGKLAWARTFGASRDDTANGVAVRGDRVVVVGAFLDELRIGPYVKQAAGSDDLFVAAFDGAGDIQWVWHAGGVDSDGANAVAAAPDGGWIVGGSFSGAGAFGDTQLRSRGGTDAFLMKLDRAGGLEWVKSFGGRYHDRIRHVGVDGQGNIYALGELRDESSWGTAKPLRAAGGADFDVVLAKYDLNGDALWAQRFGGQFDEMAGGLAVDPAGNATITGAFRKQISFGDGDDHTSLGEEDAFVARFDGRGKLQWARTYGAARDDAGNGIAADAAGNTVVTGWFQSAVDFGAGAVSSKTANKDVFVLKLDARGALVWAQTWGDRDHDQGRGVAVDERGRPYVVGLYRFQLGIVDPPLESTRADGDRIPKPDTFLVQLER